MGLIGSANLLDDTGVGARMACQVSMVLRAIETADLPIRFAGDRKRQT